MGVEERDGMMVDTTTATTVVAGTNGAARQVVTDLRREAILMMGTKMVTTEGQEMRAAMKGRRESLDQRRIMSETLKMLKVKTCGVKSNAPDLIIVLLRGSALPEQLNVIWRCLSYEFGVLFKIIN